MFLVESNYLTMDRYKENKWATQSGSFAPPVNFYATSPDHPSIVDGCVVQRKSSSSDDLPRSPVIDYSPFVSHLQQQPDGSFAPQQPSPQNPQGGGLNDMHNMGFALNAEYNSPSIPPRRTETPPTSNPFPVSERPTNPFHDVQPLGSTGGNTNRQTPPSDTNPTNPFLREYMSPSVPTRENYQQYSINTNPPPNGSAPSLISPPPAAVSAPPSNPILNMTQSGAGSHPGTPSIGSTGGTAGGAPNPLVNSNSTPNMPPHPMGGAHTGPMSSPAMPALAGGGSPAIPAAHPGSASNQQTGSYPGLMNPVVDRLKIPLQRTFSDDTFKMLEEVKTLKHLYEMEMMGKDEFEARRIQLVDQITKTTHTSQPAPPPPVSEPRLAGTERAIRHRFDVKKSKWLHTAAIVILEPNPFAVGAMRKAYRMRDLSQEGPHSLMVAKMFIDPNEDRSSYFKDVEMQMQAREIAEKFNKKDPPKKIDYVAAFVYELVDRQNKQICCAEYYIEGKFEKHNNNFGYINDEERNTPQAFSHFSYEESNGQLIVVDIQGVNDNYTDPQIHTLDGQGYGRGNLGAEGINKFFSTHSCSQICRFLGLTVVNPKQPLMDSGTKPAPKGSTQQGYQNTDRFNFGGDVFEVLTRPATLAREQQQANGPAQGSAGAAPAGAASSPSGAAANGAAPMKK